MQANELRVGNYVTVDNQKSWPDLKDKAMVVCGMEKLRYDEGGKIQLNHINDIKNIVLPAVSQFDKYIKPIPLTEEWLAKSELKLKVYNGVIKSYYAECTPDNYKSEMQLHVRFGERRDVDFMVYWYHTLKSGDMHTFTHIRYVHQLQNLYFALTNEELKL